MTTPESSETPDWLEGIEDWLVIRATFVDCHDAFEIATNIGQIFAEGADEHGAEGVEVSLIALQPPSDGREIVERRGLWEFTFLARFFEVHPAKYEPARDKIAAWGNAISATIQTAWIDDREGFFANPMMGMLAELDRQAKLDGQTDD